MHITVFHFECHALTFLKQFFLIRKKILFWKGRRIFYCFLKNQVFILLFVSFYGVMHTYFNKINSTSSTYKWDVKLFKSIRKCTIHREYHRRQLIHGFHWHIIYVYHIFFFFKKISFYFMQKNLKKNICEINLKISSRYINLIQFWKKHSLYNFKKQLI